MPLLLAAVAASGAPAIVEVPLRCGKQGLCAVNISVGTPSQELQVWVGSGSSILWVPNGTGRTSGFVPSASSSFKAGAHVELPVYADGLRVVGTAAHETVELGLDAVDASPFVVRDVVSGVAPVPMVIPSSWPGLGPTKGVGPTYRVADAVEDGGIRVDGILGLGSCPHNEESDSDPVEGFFCRFWRAQPEGTPRTFRLDAGGAAPRLVIGDAIEEGDPETGGFRFAKNVYAAKSKLWYMGVRALGIQATGSSGFFTLRRPMQEDFNLQMPFGAVALLDSGAAAIRVGSNRFATILKGMPSECKRARDLLPAIECPCGSVDEFPTLTFSIEAAGNVRFMGLDFGADFLVCMPPESYVVRDEGAGKCTVAIVDAGPSHEVFNTEAIVLGMPFFRAVSVAHDAQRRQVAIGPRSKGSDCVCTDPKNWFFTGQRLSLRRVFLCLFAVSAFSAYIYLSYSPSALAGTCRSRLGGLVSAAGTRLASASALAEQRLSDAGGARAPRLQHTGPVPVLDDSAPEMQLADQTGFVALNSDAEG